MPIINGCVGFSETTPDKQEQFRYLIRMHLAATKAIIGRSVWADYRYWYFDLNAGPGRYEGMDGSPIIFLREASLHQVPVRVIMSERDRETFITLCDNFSEYCRVPGINITAINDDHHSAVEPYLKGSTPRYGLIYSDPSGQIPPFDLLSLFSNSKSYKYCDIVIYCSATNIKRIASADHCQPTERLKDYLATINKKYWLIRQPSGKHQWTFLIGTNWADMPTFTKYGFHKLASPQGEEIFNRLNFTREEYSGNQFVNHQRAVQQSLY